MRFPRDGARLSQGGERGSLLPLSPWNSLATRWQHLTVHLFFRGVERTRADRPGPPQERCTSAPGRVSVDPSPDENGRPSTRLLASRPAVRPWGRRLTAARTLFPHPWATSPRKPRISIAPGRRVTRERVKNESSRFRGETSDKGPSLLSSPGKVRRCPPPPPGRSPASVPSKWNSVTGRFRHLPRSSLPVPTSSPRGPHCALTLGFPRESPAGGRRAHRALPRGWCHAVPGR